MEVRTELYGYGERVLSAEGMTCARSLAWERASPVEEQRGI